jgi:ribosomal protein L37AE/L43A
MIQSKQAHHCRQCGEDIGQKRWAIGYKYCLECGDAIAKDKAKQYTIAPINKSNYMLITDPALLKQLNPKRTT